MYNHINHHKKHNASQFYINIFVVITMLSIKLFPFYCIIFFQAPWCLSPALMGHTLIYTREGYKKRESVYPALQGSSAGTLDASQSQCTRKLVNMHFSQCSNTQTDTQLGIKASCTDPCSKANTHLCFNYTHDYTVYHVQAPRFTEQPN